MTDVEALTSSMCNHAQETSLDIEQGKILWKMTEGNKKLRTKFKTGSPPTLKE